MILTKQSSSIQLASLYDILYCKSIDEFFESHGLFRYLDYALNSNVYSKSGVILLEIELYTKKAEEYNGYLSQLAIDIDDISIGNGTAQIVATIKKPLASPGVPVIREGLAALHRQPWRNMDDVTFINTASTRLTTDILAIGIGSPQRTRKLTVTMALDAEITDMRPELLPLFTQLVRLVFWNCDHIVSNGFGLSDANIENASHGRHGQGLSLSLVFQVPPTGQELMNDSERLHAILLTVTDTIHTFQTNGTIRRFMQEFRGGSYTQMPSLMPDPGNILADTNVLMGMKGWQKTATVKNCDLLFAHSTVTVKYGRNHISLPIRSPKR